jgi:hypothetical protein
VFGSSEQRSEAGRGVKVRKRGSEPPLASHAVTAQPEGQYPLGSDAASDRPLASAGPYLSPLSFVSCRRYYLRQEPDAGNPLVRICAGVWSNPYPYRDSVRQSALRHSPPFLAPILRR